MFDIPVKWSLNDLEKKEFDVLLSDKRFGEVFDWLDCENRVAIIADAGGRYPGAP